MPYVDPLKVMRNPLTLQAYRDHQRALVRAGQPWIIIGAVAVALQGSLAIYRIFHPHSGFGGLNLMIPFLMLVYGFCTLIGVVRVWLYSRSHPLVLPEPPHPRIKL